MRRSTILCAAIAAVGAATTVAALALSTAGSVAAAATAEAARSQVHFIAKQSELTLEGSFDRFSAEVDLDPARPQTGMIKVSIDLASVDAGGAQADYLLKGEDFFDVSRFPSATFVSTSIMATGPGRYQASGPLSLKGRTANLVLPFIVRPDRDGLWFEGNASISRLAYKIGEGQWSDTSTLNDEVEIRFKVHVAH